MLLLYFFSVYFYHGIRYYCSKRGYGSLNLVHSLVCQNCGGTVLGRDRVELCVKVVCITHKKNQLYFYDIRENRHKIANHKICAL